MATTQISRYRPAVLALTGTAAAYGTYLVYTAFANQPANEGLRRSNAIHHQSRPSRLTIECVHLDDEAVLGKIVFRKGSTRYEVDIYKSGVPLVQDVAERFPSVPAEQYTIELLQQKTAQCVFEACNSGLTDSESSRTANALTEIGLDGLRSGWVAEDGAAVSQSFDELEAVFGIEHASARAAFIPFTPMFTTLRSGDGVADAPLPDLGQLDNAELSEIAETDDSSGFGDPAHQEPSQGLKGLLYHIAQTNAERKAYEHRGINCQQCNQNPIKGIRWHCMNCSDFDLCSTCEDNTPHPKTHVFVKVKIPLPVLSQPTKNHPIWYPGDPQRIFRSLSAEKKKELQESFAIDGPQLDAFHDQFLSIASTRSFDEFKVAIDRQAFNYSMTSERWGHRLRPTTLHDRMFAFYDIDNTGAISFRDFVSGILYLRGPKRHTPLRRALQGFDFDEDGYVDRQDFLRLLRAKYEMQQVLVYDMIEAQEVEHTHDARETMRSSQPISSVFTGEQIPSGQTRELHGKVQDPDGDLQPLDGTHTILEENEWARDPGHVQRRINRTPLTLPHEQLQRHLSRFEEQLQSPTDEAAQPRDSVAEASGVNMQDQPLLPNGNVPSRPDAQPRPMERSGWSEENGATNEDFLWQIVEDGLYEVLDPMFKIKEEEHREVIHHRPEMEKWRKEIDEVARQGELAREALKAELEASATEDPLMATAMSSLNGSVTVKPKEGLHAERTSEFNDKMVPTDHASLTKREEEIAQKDLEDLLSATGYSTVETVVEGKDCGSHAFPSNQNATEATPSGNALVDPTLPQNRPNATPHGKTSEHNHRDILASGVSHVELCPMADKLEYLLSLRSTDCEIDARGGPGRLSFDEIEAIVQSDPTRELKGLVTGWLEWASF